MQTVTATTTASPSNDTGTSIRAAARAALLARAAELDEFRRVDYSAGWDPDDALLGWVDEDVVRGARRLH